MTIEQRRRDYAGAVLDERLVDPDPLVQFGRWLREAEDAEVPEPTAMTLATVDRHGQPNARVVLLKGFGTEGFTFFTDYRSRKAEELAVNPRAALLFFWPELQRQVRLIGVVERAAPEVGEAYFRTRPRGSQLGAWASHQSSVLAGGRGELEERLREVADRFGEGPIPLPPHWGGYRLQPAEFEFWQGRPDRLHDRVRYTRSGTQWTIERLSP
jgi:pyridoxamine 5'-phosphate oxidase